MCFGVRKFDSRRLLPRDAWTLESLPEQFAHHVGCIACRVRPVREHDWTYQDARIAKEYNDENAVANGVWSKN